MLFQQDPAGLAHNIALAERCWPIGSIFLSVVATNPVEQLGFGTWVAIGAGRCLVGVDTNDSDFNTVEETGGAKTVTLTGAQSGVAAHSHGVTDPQHNHTQNSHTHPSIQVQGGTTANNAGTHIMTSTATGGSSRAATSPEQANAATATNQAASTGISINNAAAADAAQAHSNVQPYLTCYMWKRTA